MPKVYCDLPVIIVPVHCTVNVYTKSLNRGKSQNDLGIPLEKPIEDYVMSFDSCYEGILDKTFNITHNSHVKIFGIKLHIILTGIYFTKIPS